MEEDLLPLCCRIAILQVSLLYELFRVPFEPLLAGNTAKVIGLTIIGDLELGYPLIKNDTTNRIFRHYLIS